MTSLEDLLWLYKMAVQFNLEPEKAWLKEEIEARMAARTQESEDDESKQAA